MIIGGGIAAYKAPELVRRLRDHGLGVRCLLTSAATQFVAPLSLASVSGDRVYQNLFDLTDEAEMGHIQLSRDADLILVAPATADIMARMAQGTLRGGANNNRGVGNGSGSGSGGGGAGGSHLAHSNGTSPLSPRYRRTSSSDYANDW